MGGTHVIIKAVTKQELLRCLADGWTKHHYVRKTHVYVIYK